MENHMNSVKIACLFGVATLLAGCATGPQMGGGKNNPVTGAAGGSSTVNRSTQLEHCDRPLGTAAVEEDTSQQWYVILTSQYQLPATTPLLRLMIQQSNCFVIVDRGRAMGSMMAERDLAKSGELRNRSNMGAGQMVAADYIITPTIQFSQETGGGGLGAIAGAFHPLAGAVAGSMKTSEASTVLMLTDTRSGVQVSAAQGSARNTDFGFGGILAGGAAAAGAGAYAKTPQGKVIASAFMDSYNQMVQALRSYAPQRVNGGLGTGGELKVDGASSAGSAGMSLIDAQRRLKDLGLYSGKPDGISGPGTSGAIRKFQQIRGLPVTGQLDDPTAAALQQ